MDHFTYEFYSLSACFHAVYISAPEEKQYLAKNIIPKETYISMPIKESGRRAKKVIVSFLQFPK